MVIDKKARKFLKDYLSNASPTGNETKGQEIWIDYITPYVDEWHTDVYGTAYGIINPGKKYRVAIESHADEISWYVNYISEKGFIHVVRNGGSDQTIAASRRVSIHTPTGIVRGVFGWPAIHVRRGKDLNLSPTLENIFIDVCAKDKKEVEAMGIHIGCIVTYDDPYEEITKKHFIGRALDNRLGGFCMAEITRKLYEEGIKLPYSLYIVNSVQEEVGLRGAQMIAETIRPNVAIVTDVTHDTHTPLIDPKQEGDVRLGSGPAVTYAPSVHRKLLQLIEDAAKENEIPYQRVAASRSTGTDTDAFAYANGGIPSALISIPLRYMHTTVEMAHFDDVDHLISLVVASLKKIKSGHNFKYLDR
ncbi:MAG: M42 family metallopeptidase [Saprospiraceae bacterium]|uniref:M42 family metallopeptidase n=1 Tax=Candidatus Opimibacter skivensis TaxID=2982028 RepID=A0A9D7XRC4_9BACT|nr:M42 family metallopeptidase [Candidatus Opimibacter skivensis]